jgi:hypothetical protein
MKTRFVLSNFSSKTEWFMRMWKNILEPGRPQVTDACALHARYLRLETLAHHVRNTYRCPTATIDARTCLTAA